MQPRNVRLVHTRRRTATRNVEPYVTDQRSGLTVGTVLIRILIAAVIAVLFLQFMYLEGQDVAMGVVTG